MARNPVWDVYNLLRTVRLNEKYYNVKRDFLVKLNIFFEITLLVTAPGSALVIVWETEIGKVILPYLAGLAAFLALLKPLISLTDKIRQHEEVYTGYRSLYQYINRIRFQINQDEKYGQTHKIGLNEALAKRYDLVNSEPKSKPDKKLIAKCQREVNKELPPENFYIPT